MPLLAPSPSVTGDDQHGTPLALRTGMTLLDDWGAAGCGGCRAAPARPACLSAAAPQQTGGSAGHHAVMVVSAGGAVTPPVNPHAAASTMLKPHGFARTREILMIEK